MKYQHTRIYRKNSIRTYIPVDSMIELWPGYFSKQSSVRSSEKVDVKRQADIVESVREPFSFTCDQEDLQTITKTRKLILRFPSKTIHAIVVIIFVKCRPMQNASYDKCTVKPLICVESTTIFNQTMCGLFFSDVYQCYCLNYSHR